MHSPRRFFLTRSRGERGEACFPISPYRTINTKALAFFSAAERVAKPVPGRMVSCVAFNHAADRAVSEMRT